MEDSMILALYNNREEAAITETASKYGGYCTKIAMNILNNRQDADECVNDTWLKAWNAIPPKMPAVLSLFLGRITRNLSIDVYNANRRKKRGGDDTTIMLEELGECISMSSNTEDDFDFKETKEAINSFLRSIKEEPRVVFIRRYWYADSVADIARRYKMSESKVKSLLMRTRNKLKQYLEEGGVII